MVQITNDFRCRAIGAHLPCEVMIEGVAMRAIGINHEQHSILIKSKYKETLPARLTSFPFAEVTMLGKPLSEITNEHAAALMQIERPKKNNKIIKPTKSTTILVKRMLKYCFKYQSWRLSIEAIDFLRLNHYILPFQGIDLIAAGIAVSK